MIDTASDKGSWQDALASPSCKIVQQDSGDLADAAAIVSELNRVKALFQLRTIAAVIGACAAIAAFVAWHFIDMAEPVEPTGTEDLPG